MIAHNPITVISGRGGTGKTEIVTTVLSSLNEIAQQMKTNLKVMTMKLIKRASSTLHPRVKLHPLSDIALRVKHIQFTKLSPHTKSFLENRMKAESGPWKYATIKVIVVDECSMVGMCLFSHILNILYKDAELKKVILLGDVLQLPSIDPGSLMSDIYQAFKSRSYSIELVTNHRSEGSLIFNNAKRIMDKSIELKVDCQNKSQIITFTRKECELLNNSVAKYIMTTIYSVTITNKDVPLLTIHNNVIVKRKEDRLMNGSVFIIDSLKSYKGLSREEKEGENVTESESSSALSYELDNLQVSRLRNRPIVYSVSNSRNENWQHVYTAITRGKKKVIIIGSKLHLEAAILRDPKPRQTRLKSLLDDLLNSLSENPRKNNVDDEIASTISDEKNDTSLLSDDLSMVDESSFQDTELDSSLWQDNESFDIMLSQMDATTDNDAWQNDSFDQVLSQIQYDSGDVTPPNSPLSKQRMTCLTPEMSSKLKLSMG
ncbi:HELB [Lepeophtheirus salmonis]|uniref:HELB n=1 Tax=Lepeophtheirus salmonis TaxID=72036 RepID=A0A7R8GZZ8_LEPSM|nr:HELB [Lepeophtheirus salmonis]CAF2760017.1 HELB [Lepeophtheirus salmonis]